MEEDYAKFIEEKLKTDEDHHKEWDEWQNALREASLAKHMADPNEEVYRRKTWDGQYIDDEVIKAAPIAAGGDGDVFVAAAAVAPAE